jgi:murein DD-endopeptidase MepM/ murein hydrolase activator NlpD
MRAARRPVRTPVRLAVERLEDRTTPTGNLHITGATLVDASDAAEAAPVTGQMVYVQATWTTTGLVGGEQYVVRFSVDGVPADSGTITGQAGTNLSYYWYRGGWYAAPGTHTAQVTLDPDNNVQETDKTDNSLTFQFTTVPPTDLPSKFIRPIGYMLNKDWAINNYADVDPRPGVVTDYRGGPFTYDGHDAIDAGPWGFNRQDAGMPIYAAADGVVSAVVDGLFDRNTATNNSDGNHVWIDHGNGWQTLYYHFARNTITVKVGDHVKAGQLIGLMGSSGNSTGTHLHFTPYYRGCEVEMGYDTATYETDPMPYGGDVPGFAFEAGVTNYDPSPDINEHASPLTTFTTTQTGSVYAWCEFYDIKLTDTLAWKWYRPDGSLAFTGSFAPGPNIRFGWYYYTYPLSTFQSVPGTWQVAQSINSVEVERTAFTIVSGAGVPAVKVTDSNNKILLDERTTPVDFGSVAQGGTPPAQTFTIVNHGTADLTPTNLVLPPGFSLVGSLPATVAGGASATFTVQLDTTVIGAKFGALRFDTNDPLVGTYNFNLSGTVTGTATGPTIALPDPALAYNFQALPRPLSPGATLTGTAASYTALVVEFAAGGTANDHLGVQNQGTGAGQIGVSGNAVSYGGTAIGTFTGGVGTSPLTFTLNASATQAAVQALLQAITYADVGATPSTAPRFVRFTATDVTGVVSNMAVKNVSPSDVARKPTVAALPAKTVTRGTTLTQGGSFTDATGFAWTATVDYGDGSGVQPLTLNTDKTFTLSHAYAAAAGPYTVTVTVVNDFGGFDTKTLALTVAAPIQVSAVQVDDGSGQRSMVRTLAVTFSRAVTSYDSGAFTVTGPGGSVAFSVAFNAAGTVATLTFTGGTGGSLDDGRYALALDATKFHDDSGGTLDGDGDGLSGGAYAGFNFFRYYGDVNGDGVVNGADFAFFRPAFGTTAGNPAYLSYLDYDGDGAINGTDFAQFRARFGTALP